jgi:hypothetical protein
MSPVREPQNHSGSYTGKFPSLKMKRMIHFESGVEKDFIYLLEFDERITNFEEQPLRIEYKIGNQSHTYTPDFQAFIDGENFLYECKPEKYVSKIENQLKFDVANRWCNEQGWGFQVITAELIRSGCRLKNVKYLTSFSRSIVRSELIAKIYAFFKSIPTARLIDVVEHIPEYSVREIYPALFHMIYHHRLTIPIDKDLISPVTEVRLA